jgi:uncharacterized protein
MPINSDQAKQNHALKELKDRLLNEFDIQEIILFGSAARGEADNESDCDLLILTSHPVKTRFDRHKITDAVFEINLCYDTNFSSLVIDRASWEVGPISVLPVHEQILKQGVAI